MPKKIKRRKLVKHETEGSGTQYMGIGHSGGGVSVWAYIDGKLAWWEDHRTHADVLGDSRFDYWRGRYEGFTGKMSIVPPCSTKYRYPPRWLVQKLESVFGGHFEIHAFNPPRRTM